MTRSKIQKMKFFIFLLIFLLAQTSVCDGSFRERRDAPATEAKKASPVFASENKGADEQVGKPDPGLVAAKKPAVEDKTHDNITSSKSSPSNAANKTHNPESEQPSDGHATFNTGALVRGFLVFVGLSILVMAYIVFRSFRLSKTRAQLVRKYGVLTHRQDVEMRPLPLEEEDDEDTTVFDASNVVTSNVQHQNA